MVFGLVVVVMNEILTHRSHRDSKSNFFSLIEEEKVFFLKISNGKVAHVKSQRRSRKE